MGVAVDGHAGVRPGLCNEESDRTHPSRRDLVAGMTMRVMEPYAMGERGFEVFLRGPKKVEWKVVSPVAWMCVGPASGVLDPNVEDHDCRVRVEVDWDAVPEGFDDEVLLVVESDVGDYEHIHVPIRHRSIPQNFTGHVESDRTVSIPATRFANKDMLGVWIHKYLGREDSGAVSVRQGLESDVKSCELVYPFYIFTPAPQAVVKLYFTLTLDTHPTSRATYSIALDDQDLGMQELVQSPGRKGELPPGWLECVMDCVWIKTHEVDFSDVGNHVLKVSLYDENMALEKIVVDLGGVRESYLGPPESFYAVGSRELEHGSDE